MAKTAQQIQGEMKKIQSLRDGLETCKNEIQILDGRIANRQQDLVERYKAENQRLREKIEKLEVTYYYLLLEQFVPRTKSDAQISFENLRKSTADFFQSAKIEEKK